MGKFVEGLQAQFLIMKYTHPHKRGFSFGWDCEGFHRIWFLFRKWEFTWTKITLQFDYVKNFFDNRIEAETKKRSILEMDNTALRSRLIDRKDYYQYED